MAESDQGGVPKESVTLMSPEAGPISILRNALLALQLLPDNASAGGLNLLLLTVPSPKLINFRKLQTGMILDVSCIPDGCQKLMASSEILCWALPRSFHLKFFLSWGIAKEADFLSFNWNRPSIAAGFCCCIDCCLYGLPLLFLQGL